MQKTTVLIVDDEHAARASLRVVDWEAHGYRLVGEAENGQQALEMIDRYRPDIVLADIVMPGMSGLDLIPEMKRRHPPLQVILITMHRDFEYAREALRLGAQEYLLKGAYSQMDLLRVLERAKVALHAARQQLELDEADTFRQKVEALARFLYDGGDLPPGLALPAEAMLVRIGWRREQSLLLRLVFETKSLRALGPFSACHPVAPGEWLLLYGPGQSPPQALDGLLAAQEAAAQEPFDITATAPYPTPDPQALRTQTALWRGCFAQRFYLPDCHVVDNPGYVRAVPAALYRGLEKRFVRFYGEQADDPDFLADALAACMHEQVSPEHFKQLLTGWQRTVERQIYQDTPQISGQLLEARSAQEALRVFRSFLIAYRMERANTGRLEVNQALAYIRDHLGEGLSVEGLAAYVGLSTNHFNSLFKGQTGESVHEHIVRMRMERAGTLLRESSLRVYEVADAVGMPNVRYFTQAFARFYGVRPSAWREHGHG